MCYTMENNYFSLKLNQSYLLNPSERHLQHLLLLLQLFQVVGFERGAWQRLAEDVIHWGSPEPAQTCWQHINHLLCLKADTYFYCSKLLAEQCYFFLYCIICLLLLYHEQRSSTGSRDAAQCHSRDTRKGHFASDEAALLLPR